MMKFWITLFAVFVLATSACAGASLSLSWTDNSDNEEHFEVQRSANGTDFDAIGLVDANVTTFQDDDVAGGQRYWYRVRAGNSFGWSGFTNTADALAPTSINVGTLLIGASP